MSMAAYHLRKPRNGASGIGEQADGGWLDIFVYAVMALNGHAITGAVVISSSLPEMSFMLQNVP